MAYGILPASLKTDETGRRLLLELRLPMTAKQLSRRTGLTYRRCKNFFRRATRMGWVQCLNEKAKSNRFYWLTEPGYIFQARIGEEVDAPISSMKLPRIDWKLFGWLCYSRRIAVLNVLTEPMQACTLRRRIRAKNDGPQMTADKTRVVVKQLLHAGLVQHAHQRRRKKRPLFELSDRGRRYRDLLLRVWH